MEPLATPTGLDVTPLPLRRAELSWSTGDNPSGTRYVVERRDFELASLAWTYKRTTVAPATGAAPAPTQPMLATSSASIRILGLSSTLIVSSDRFTARAANLTPSSSYVMKVYTRSPNLGFNDTCTDRQETVEFTVAQSASEYVEPYTIYACGPTRGTVQAELQQGAWSNTKNPNDKWDVYDSGDDIDSIEIELDDILVDEKLDQFRIKATKAGRVDSEYSEEVTIIDSPLLVDVGRVDGRSTGSSGHGTLQWEEIPEAETYTVRYRQLLQGHQSEGPYRIYYPPHSHDTWPTHSSWPYPDPSSSTVDFSSPAPQDGVVTKVIRGLTKGSRIHAVQLNYVTSNGKKVFSARDVYVWPSSGFPGDADRPEQVATYPFFGHHNNRDFTYIICESDFPTADWSRWQRIIEHAFEQWEWATDGLVTVTRDVSGTCPEDPQGDDRRMRQFIITDDEQSEVRMLDRTRASVWSFPEVKSDAFKGFCDADKPACVTSFTGYGGTSSTDRRIRIAGLVQAYASGDIPFGVVIGALLANVIGGSQEASNAVQSVDVTFSYKKEDGTLRFHTGDAPGDINMPEVVSFNTCNDLDDDDDSPDKGYYAYTIAVHEAGHALGLSRVSVAEFWQPYDVAHPTIPDAVMNYDRQIRYPAADDLKEPDCSPHPFDVLALYALYQTVPAVSVAGHDEGVEGTRIRLTAEVSGGVPPYSFDWTSLGTLSGSGASVQVTLPEIDGALGTTTVFVKVTDKNGTGAKTQHVITVRSRP